MRTTTVRVRPLRGSTVESVSSTRGQQFDSRGMSAVEVWVGGDLAGICSIHVNGRGYSVRVLWRDDDYSEANIAGVVSPAAHLMARRSELGAASEAGRMSTSDGLGA